MKKIFIVIAVVVMLVTVTMAVRADGRTVTPNTAQDNKTEGWAYAEVVKTNGGDVVLKFTSTRAFESCFEYRTDEDNDFDDNSDDYNDDYSDDDSESIADGQYPYVCVNNNTKTVTLSGIEYVEIRMVSSEDTDELFDWTMYEVNNRSDDKDQCKKDGWMALGFKNQGQCIANVNNEYKNEDNQTEGWAYVDVVNSDDGNVVLNFVSTKDFESCFEYRTDLDIAQTDEDNDSDDDDTSITDSPYQYVCVNNSIQTVTLSGINYVEIRMVHSVENDEHIDWTRYEVNQRSDDKDQCKNGGWMALGFKNQGQCIKNVNTGK